MECPICHKPGIKNMGLHNRNSHPELFEEKKTPGSVQGKQPPEPNPVPDAIDARIKTAVVETLNEMRIGEAIKGLAEAQANLSQQIKPLTDMIKHSEAQSGNGQPKSLQDTQLRDSIIAAVIQKFLGGGGGDSTSLDSLVKTLESAKALGDIFTKPYLEGAASKQKEISETLRMLRDAGASADAARDTIIKRTES